MAFGRPSWIAAELVGQELATQVIATYARTVTYPNTSGPWYGIGGSAMTDFDITLLVMRGGTVVAFADKRVIGWRPHMPASDLIERFQTEPLRVDWLEPIETCPFQVYEATA
jgi:hypothetical protein